MRLLRSVAFNLWFYGLTLAFSVAGLRVAARVRRQGRLVIIPFAKRWARLALAGLRPLVGIDWRIEGQVPGGGPALLAAQHQSAFETILWVLLLPDFCFVVKQELTRIPLFGAMVRVSGMIAVDREGGAAAMRGMLRAAERAAAEGRQIVIFPEGTRVAPGTTAMLHPGIAALAARTGLPVIPVVTDSGRLWGRNAFRKHPGTIHVRVLPALSANLQRNELLARLAAAYAAGPGE